MLNNREHDEQEKKKNKNKGVRLKSAQMIKQIIKSTQEGNRKL